MATITEGYVSFETAKLLKEKGFDEKTIYYYQLNCYDEPILSGSIKNFYNRSTNKYCCCTLQMAMKWLRIKHNLYIEPYVIKNYNNKKLEYTYSIQDLDFNGSDDGIECCKNWNSPEEACEAAIKYCLEHLI